MLQIKQQQPTHGWIGLDIGWMDASSLFLVILSKMASNVYANVRQRKLLYFDIFKKKTFNLLISVLFSK